MDINETRTINAFALKELAGIMGLTPEELDNYITKVRNDMMEDPDLHISEAIPKIIENRSMNDIMTGVILAIFTSDYYMDQFIMDDTDDNR